MRFDSNQDERSFEVDVAPPKLFKREIIRPKYHHRLDRTRVPLVAAAPARPVAGGYVPVVRRVNVFHDWHFALIACDLLMQEKICAAVGMRF